MNEFQEAILDRLMVEDRIGEYWKPGPLLLAVAVLQDAGLTKHDEPVAALGFPPMLCAAVCGAARAARSTDDLRTLAISLFTEVAPTARAAKVPAREQIAAVSWSLARVPSYCRVPGRVAAEVGLLAERYLSGERPKEQTIVRLSNALHRDLEGMSSPHPERDPERRALSAHYFALHALRRASVNEDPAANAEYTARDVAAAAGLARGVAGSLPYCVELARQLGL
jgi:hypothetical protein